MYHLISIYCNRVIRINQNTSSGITDNNLLHLQEGHEILGQYLAYPIQRYPWTNLVKYRNQKERKKYLQYPYYNLCFHHQNCHPRENSLQHLQSFLRSLCLLWSIVRSQDGSISTTDNKSFQLNNLRKQNSNIKLKSKIEMLQDLFLKGQTHFNSANVNRFGSMPNDYTVSTTINSI